MDGIQGQHIDQWHLYRQGKQYGPYCFPTLVEAVRKGRLSREDQVWRPGWTAWRPAHSLPGLFRSTRSDALPGIQPGASNIEASIDGSANVDVELAIKDRNRGDKKIEKDGFPRRNYFIRHWRGELALPISYWINVVLANVAISSATYMVLSFLDTTLGAGLPIASALTCFLLVTLLLATWQIVGTWRSASNYAASGKKFWAGAAKFIIILGVATTAGNLAKVYYPILSEHIEIAMGDKEMGDNHFRLLRNGTELALSGGIKTGTAKEFERMLDAAGQLRVVHLSSHGGRLAEANLVAAQIKKRILITYVSDYCESACTHVFLAGRERWLGRRGTLGFHQPDIPGLDRKVAAQFQQEERLFLASMHLPNDFISRVLATPNEKMWYPTQQELLAAQVISGISDGSDFASTGSLVSVSDAELRQKFLTVPLFSALKHAEPKRFEFLIEQLVAGYNRGASEEEIKTLIRSTVASSAFRQLPYASDKDLFKWVEIAVGYMSGLKSVDPESCVAIDDDSKGARIRVDLQAKFPDIVKEELALAQALIEANAFGSRTIPSTQEVRPYLTKVISNLDKRSDVQLSILDKRKLGPDDYRAYCAATLAFYQEVRRLPQDEASAVLRNLYVDASK